MDQKKKNKKKTARTCDVSQAQFTILLTEEATQKELLDTMHLKVHSPQQFSGILFVICI